MQDQAAAERDEPAAAATRDFAKARARRAQWASQLAAVAALAATVAVSMVRHVHEEAEEELAGVAERAVDQRIRAVKAESALARAADDQAGHCIRQGHIPAGPGLAPGE